MRINYGYMRCSTRMSPHSTKVCLLGGPGFLVVREGTIVLG